MLDKNLIYDVLSEATKTGGDFAEIFVENKVSNSVSMVNGIVEKSSGGVDFGVGIRIFNGFSAIYAYTNDTSKEHLIKIAREAALAIKNNSNIKVLDFINREIENKHIIKDMPTSYSKKYAIEHLRIANESAFNSNSLISQTSLSYLDYKQDILIANTESLFITDSRVRTRFMINAVASSGNDKESGYVSHGGHCGFEIFNNFDMKAEGEECAEVAVTMLNAENCPAGKMPVIIENGFGGVIFHEACGHSLEATAIAKDSSVFCNKLGEKIANEKVTAIDDGTIPNYWGSANIDDEGELTRKNVLIEKGVLKSYLVDKLNGKKMNMESTGSSRRESYRYAPTSRMTNTFIDNGNDKLEEIIGTTENGIYAKKMGGGSVQPATGEFNFSVLEGYIIKNGKICQPVKGATLIGKGSEVLMNIDMVGNNLEQAQGMCGSISGTIPTNVGQPTIRVQNITVGGRS